MYASKNQSSNFPARRSRTRGVVLSSQRRSIAALLGVVLASGLGVHPTIAASPELTTVEIVDDDPTGLAAAVDLALDLGGYVVSDSPSAVLVRVPVAEQARLTARIHGRVRTPFAVDVIPQSLGSGDQAVQFGPINGDEVAITNATAWHAAGIDGSGIKVGVIDYFDVTKFWNEAEHGPKPVKGLTAKCLTQGSDCTDEFFDGIDSGSEDHGVAVVEAIRDMAPGVEIFLGQALTTPDYRALVDWFAANGVTVINRSLGSRFDGPGDGRSPLDDVVAYAVSKGILWVNSAGNNGANHYYRHPARIANNRIAFGDSGNDTFLRFSGCVSLAGVRWANDWDLPRSLRTDYDVNLWESPVGQPANGTIVGRSAESQRAGAPPIEHIADRRCPKAGNALYLEIVLRAGTADGDLIEILDYDAGMTAHTQSAYSASTSVVDSTDPGVIAVGAISPASSGLIASYSSQGPTNDGRLAPDVAAPGSFSSSIGGSFAGTSAASAVMAGAAALLLDGGLATGADTLGNLIRHLTIDRGATGPDNVFGHGEFRLPAPPVTAIDQTPSRFVSVASPTRILDTRPTEAIGPTNLIGPLSAGEIRDLPVVGVAGVPPTGVTAVAVNITTVDADRPSFVQAIPTNRASLGSFSNLNTDSIGQTRANFAIVPLGDGGTISLYSIASGNLVVDLLGWFESTSGPVTGGRFVELPGAERVLDTRVDAPIGPLQSTALRSVRWPTGVDPQQVTAIVVTVTGTGASNHGWVQAFPSDLTSSIGTTSTINLTPGGTVANTAIVPVGEDGIAVTGFFVENGSSDVVVDAIGYITSSAAPSANTGRYVPVRPNRAFDSRITGGDLVDGQIVVVDGSDAPGVNVPDDASGVVWNLAAISVRRPGFVRGWAADQVEPATSALNWVTPGEVRAGAAITAVDLGRARFRMEDGSANLPSPVGGFLADVFGYFT